MISKPVYSSFRTVFIQMVVASSLAISVALDLQAMDARSGSARPVLRTFSVIPQANPLFCAIESENVQDVQQLVQTTLPNALDRQYALFEAGENLEIRTCLLDSIRSYWFERIKKAPRDGIELFLFCYKQLIAATSFPQGVIDRSFMQMFTRLRNEVIKLISRLPAAHRSKLLKEALKMPYERDPEPLVEAGARALAQKIYDERLDLSATLEQIPEDLHPLVATLYGEIRAANSMRMDLQNSQ